MKVSGKDPNLSLLAYVQNVRHPHGGSETGRSVGDTGKRDTVSISAQGREIRHAVALAKAAPDVREDVVAAIRTRIEKGTYEIDSDRIAAKMVAESLLNDGE